MSYRDVSFWLDDLGQVTPRAGLPGDRDVDVAILGAGFTGLWTALELLRREPAMRVAVLEEETAGFGASGRNGSWCVAGLGLTLGELRRRHGPATARRVTRLLRDTVDEIGRVCADEGIDAQFHKAGLLRIAHGRHQVPEVRAAYDERVGLGLDDGVTLLTAAQLRRRVGVHGVHAAMADAHCATLHPGRLVRGLADLVQRRGGKVWEQTPVVEVRPRKDRQRPQLRTRRGTVTAEAVVLAGEAFLTRLRPYRRQLLPVYSLVVLTEPLTDAQLDAIGWQGRECLGSQRLSVEYLARTADGRVLLGGRGAPYRFGSRISPALERHAPTHRMLRERLVALFPALAGIRFTHAWGGAVAMPRDFCPTFAYDPATGVAAAYGYGGQGVAATNLGGRIVADLLTGQGAVWADLPMVDHRPRRWPPEPLRWVGVRYVQGALARLDARGERTGRARSDRTLAEWLIRH